MALRRRWPPSPNLVAALLLLLLLAFAMAVGEVGRRADDPEPDPERRPGVAETRSP